MDEAAQRHIELQSPEDLLYLINNVRRAAADSINAAFPPVLNDDGTAAPPEEDELRNQIEKLVNDYITKTFTLALPNLTINGLTIPDPASYLDSLDPASSPLTTSPGKKPKERIEYEPFDGRKRDKIEQLVSEEEDLLRSIAQLKRKVPKITATKWAEATKQEIESDDLAQQKVITKARQDGKESGKKALEGMGEMERQEGVETRFKEAVEALGRLKRDMPVVVAKMERARVAGRYVTRSTTAAAVAAAAGGGRVGASK
ncbi:hypothetical protein QBC35DRAFT_484506 [Podospora australis]|uniref:Kinetochore protein mis14 n=1 Tax=Podospora australis TaxID=1536484 RepID=A0AAN6X2K5_9PEZI|nr:hypothetical protein QBC35DRAFT_484506 [Podospora australis]